jgi:hypothetical protein
MPYGITGSTGGAWGVGLRIKPLRVLAFDALSAIHRMPPSTTMITRNVIERRIYRVAVACDGRDTLRPVL